MSLSDRIRDEMSLTEEAGRTVDWDMRKSNPARGDWWACCPFHGEASPSFHVTEPGGIGGRFYCFGCQAGGSVIDFVMARDGIEAGEAIRRLARPEWREESDADRAARDQRRAAAQTRAEAQRAEAARAGLGRAQEIWTRTRPGGEMLATYLEGRGIRLGALGGVPPSLRLHPDLPCWEEGGKSVLHRGPAMVARVGRAAAAGVHITWIDGPARARTAGQKIPKKMRGATGAMFGQPVALTRPAPVMIAGEGIETTLAVLAAIRLASPAARIGAEAALSRPALVGRGDGTGWVPPEGTRGVILLADPSSRAPDVAREMTHAARARLQARDLAVRVALPRGRWDHDEDFADLALAGALFEGV
ncbi:hypothetical protein ACSSV4_000617 [Roseovarius sp. MBR-154]|jgi:hypothetical protein